MFKHFGLIKIQKQKIVILVKDFDSALNVKHLKEGKKIMKKLLRYFVLVIFGTVIAGCSNVTKEQIKIKSQGGRADIFVEVKDGVTIPEGYADLIIKAHIKTHLEGYYIGESKKSLHGKPEYPFLINIDGQAAIWKVHGVKETSPEYDKDGKRRIDPEAGTGMKYYLSKRVRVPAGLHRIFFGLPEERYFLEVEVTLREGESAVLEFKPLYKTNRIPKRIPTFLKGIDKYEVFLDGKPVKSLTN